MSTITSVGSFTDSPAGMGQELCVTANREPSVEVSHTQELAAISAELSLIKISLHKSFRWPHRKTTDVEAAKRTADRLMDYVFNLDRLIKSVAS